MLEIRPNDVLKCRTIWISDVHLGSKHCKAKQLLEFLDRIECDQLYLVGDIVDLLAMKRRVHWPTAHNRVISRFIKLARRKRSNVIYIPGNHDFAFRSMVRNELGKIAVHRDFIHETVDGKKMLVTHGDELDYAVRYSRLNRFVGDIAYELLMSLNRFVNAIRALAGLRYWSLSKWVKVNVSQAESAISAYQQAAVLLARDRGLDGIICGHLHYPLVEQVGDVTYCNDGDWVENCTALVEDYAGEFQLVSGLDLAPTSIAQLYPRAA